MIKSVLFGIVQGISEFLPISSSGHLVLLHEFFELNLDNELAFDVFLHLASISAVIIYFRKDVLFLLKSFIRSLQGDRDNATKIPWMIIAGTVPAALAGFFLDDFIEDSVRSIAVVPVMLILIAFLFIYIEKFQKKAKIKKYSDMSFIDALKIGFAQALALIPGTSRSGITIISGMSLGLKREEAIRYSFLLSIPIILGASVKKFPALLAGGISPEMLVAFAASFVSAILTIKYFLKFAQKYSLVVFAYYRIVLAFFLITIFYL